MSDVRSVDAAPRASILVESLRDVGYTLETALADVIDNSISARATIVHIHVHSEGPEAKIAIVDNGRGMSRGDLINAMRLGSRHPKEEREARDLGRFGLGLKTASFSQCRRLTVVVRKGPEEGAATWDLDHVAATDNWSLQVHDSLAGLPFVEELGAEGVLVIWERMDRAAEQAGTDAGRRAFIRRMDEARSHLELVFHRYLTGEAGVPKVQILLNNLPLVPFDPFHSSHSATIRGQTESVLVGDGVVQITPFTLPHHRNVTATDWEHYGGQEGYLKNQGFYLYREKRLIVYGTWFGLARQMELTKLTRVRIDMPSAMDTHWHVDVKKASARPPVQVRERLRSIIGAIGAPSVKVYRQRGTALHDNRLQLWQRFQKENEIVYGINDQSPLVTSFEARLPEELKGVYRRLLAAIAAGLPLDAIFADLAEMPESVKAQPLTDGELDDLLRISVARLAQAGVQPAMIPEMLRVVEPFRSNWDRTEELIGMVLASPEAGG